MSLFELTDNEEWRDVVGFEGLYQVSNLGRVKSIDRIVNGRRYPSHIMNIQTNGGVGGYRSISLNKEGKSYNKLIHRLVAEAFVPNLNNLPEVNHKDSNPANNTPSNLEWVTARNNSLHRIQHGTVCHSYRKRVRCLETGEIFSSITQAANSVDADAQQVIDSINAQRCCKGRTFVYENNIPEDLEYYMRQAHEKYQKFHRRPNMQNSKKVREVETGKIFDSIAAASRYYVCDKATITNRIKAKKAFNGVTLEFVE